MKKYYQSIFALFALFLSISQAAEKGGIALIGNPVWGEDYHTFRITCRDEETKQLFLNVEFSCQNKIPVRYILLGEEKFPPLNLENPLSCENYVQNVSNYFSSMKIARREYAYRAIVNGKVIECVKTPATQFPLFCIFNSLGLKVNYDFHRIELDFLKVCFNDNGGNVLMDVASKMRGRFEHVQIPFKTEGQSSMDYIVSTSADLTGRVYDATGSIQVLHLPAIPGVAGFEADRESRIVTYRKGATLYEDALASRIRPDQEAEEILHPIGLESLETSSSGYSSLSTSSSMSMEESMFESENWRDQDSVLEKHFRLRGPAHPERRVLSPYIYNNGTKLFLTQTIEQDCQPYVNGVAEEDSSWVLTYTILTPYPVQVRGFSPSSKASGLYQLEKHREDQEEKGYWYKLDGAYDPQHMFAAHSQESHGSLTQTILSQTETYDLKTTLELAGVLIEYAELEGQTEFQQLINQLRTSTIGMLKVIKAIPPEKAHIILPFLLTIRDRDDLEDRELMGPTAFDYFKNKNKCEWNFGWEYTGCEYLSLKKKCARFETIYPFTSLSLRMLPLLTTTDQAWDKRSLGLITGARISGELFEEGPDYYRYISWYLSLDGLKKFSLMPQRNYDSDRKVTMQPLADCLRFLKNLESLTTPRYMGYENLKHLLHALCHNRSIKELIISDIYGNSPLKLIGELLAKNATIRILCIGARITDYEAFNELGRGLRMNKTLEELNINGCSNDGYQDTEQHNINDWVEQPGDMELDARNYKPNIGYSFQRYFVRRPLPGRTERGCTTHDFSEFREAILQSNLKIIYARRGYNLSDQMALISMLEHLNKPGLEIKISPH